MSECEVLKAINKTIAARIRSGKRVDTLETNLEFRINQISSKLTSVYFSAGFSVPFSGSLEAVSYSFLKSF